MENKSVNAFVELIKMGCTFITTYIAGDIQIHGKLNDFDFAVRFDMIEVRDGGDNIEYGLIAMYHSILTKLLENDPKVQKQIDILEKSPEYQAYLRSEISRVKGAIKYYQNTPVMEYDGCDEYAMSDRSVEQNLDRLHAEMETLKKKLIKMGEDGLIELIKMGAFVMIQLDSGEVKIDTQISIEMNGRWEKKAQFDTLDLLDVREDVSIVYKSLNNMHKNYLKIINYASRKTK